MNNRISSLRLIWLQAFLEVHRTGSALAAARNLGCSNVMVGRYIAQLEQWYGAKLFRSGGGSHLTDGGINLASTAALVLQLLDDARNFENSWREDQEVVSESDFQEVDAGKGLPADPLRMQIALRLAELKRMERLLTGKNLAYLVDEHQDSDGDEKKQTEKMIFGNSPKNN